MKIVHYPFVAVRAIDGFLTNNSYVGHVYSTTRNWGLAGIEKACSLWKMYTPRPLQTAMTNHPGKIAIVVSTVAVMALVYRLWFQVHKPIPSLIHSNPQRTAIVKASKLGRALYNSLPPKDPLRGALAQWSRLTTEPGGNLAQIKVQSRALIQLAMQPKYVENDNTVHFIDALQLALALMR